MEEITKEKIQSLCIPQSYDKGVRYLREGRLQELDAVGEQVTAKVQGTRLYEVRLDLSQEDFGARCSCPYDWGGYCKHIVATLLKLGEMDLEQLKTTSEKREKRVREGLQKADGERLREFLKKEFEGNPDLQRRFLAAVSDPEGESSVQDYKRRVRGLYREVAGRKGLVEYDDHIDFSPLYDLARTHSDSGNFREAAKVYRAVSEVIAEEMDRVDDSTGYYGDEFRRAINHYAAILEEGNLGSQAKKTHIDYLFEKYIQNDPDYFQEHYEEALKKLCSRKSDYWYWRELLQPHLPEELPEEKERGWNPERYQARRHLLMGTHILEKLNKHGELEELFQRTYREEGEFCLRYVDWLTERGREGKAMEVAEEGLQQFGRRYSKNLRKKLIDLYENSDPGSHKQNLLELYLEESRKEYYEKLKASCSEREWGEIREVITAGLNRGDLIRFHLLEGETKEAFNLVVESESLGTLKYYLGELADQDPERYFEAYADRLASYLAENTGRRHYRKVIGHLRELKKLGLNQRLKGYVASLKEEHSNRPAFLDELSSFNID